MQIQVSVKGAHFQGAAPLRIHYHYTTHMHAYYVHANINDIAQKTSPISPLLHSRELILLVATGK